LALGQQRLALGLWREPMPKGFTTGASQTDGSDFTVLRSPDHARSPDQQILSVLCVPAV